MNTSTRQSGRPTQRGGWILVEAMLAVALLGMLLTGMTWLLGLSGRMNHYLHTQQRCIAAGQAQLDSFSATGEGIPEQDVVRLWPGLRVQVTVSEGAGDWAGLRLVTAAVTGKSRDRDVTVTLRRYVPAAKGAP